MTDKNSSLVCSTTRDNCYLQSVIFSLNEFVQIGLFYDNDSIGILILLGIIMKSNDLSNLFLWYYW